MSWLQIVPGVAAYLILALATAYALQLADKTLRSGDGRLLSGTLGLVWPAVILAFLVAVPAWLIGWLASRARR